MAWVEDPQKGALTFLQLTVPLLTYVPAWRAADRAEQVLDRLAQLCLLGLEVVTVLLQLSQTEAFKTHFLFGSDATLTDVVTLSPKFNTTGRREAWPARLKAHSDATYQRRRAQDRAHAAPRTPRTLAASPTGYGTSFTERRN